MDEMNNIRANDKSNQKILIIKLLNMFRIDCLELKVICEWKNKIKINDRSNPLTHTIRNVISPAFNYSPFQMFHLPATLSEFSPASKLSYCLKKKKKKLSYWPDATCES